MPLLLLLVFFTRGQTKLVAVADAAAIDVACFAQGQKKMGGGAFLKTFFEEKKNPSCLLLPSQYSKSFKNFQFLPGLSNHFFFSGVLGRAITKKMVLHSHCLKTFKFIEMFSISLKDF